MDSDSAGGVAEVEVVRVIVCVAVHFEHKLTRWKEHSEQSSLWV